jgi:hypothetical protein
MNVHRLILGGVVAVVLCLVIIAGKQAKAEVFRLAILHGDVEVFDYEIGLVKLALEYADGDHQLELVLLPRTPQERLLLMMEDGSEINVFFTGHSPAREKQFLQVDFPMTRGLLGNRIFVTRPDMLSSLRQVETLDDLKKFIIGSGTGWPDTTVFRENGFNVVSSSYENLWKMLENERFDIFNRGIHEAFVEIGQQRDQGRDLVIDHSVQVIYPFDYFLYLNKTDTRRHAILTQGFQRAYDSGAFDTYFNNHPMVKHVFEDSNLSNRKHFFIDNPGMSQRLRDLPSDYWQVF